MNPGLILNLEKVSIILLLRLSWKWSQFFAISGKKPFQGVWRRNFDGVCGGTSILNSRNTSALDHALGGVLSRGRHDFRPSLFFPPRQGQEMVVNAADEKYVNKFEKESMDYTGE